MGATVAGLVTPHLMRIVDFARAAENGVTVDWHLRDAVTRTMVDLRDQWNAPALVAAYVAGLETEAGRVGPSRPGYHRALKTAANAARSFGRV